MPRLSEELREERRRHILISAWSCFSRNGFHVTSMDDIIAATGMSSSAVYRYFRSKDDLIDAAADEALVLVRDLFDQLLERRPTPTPAEVIQAMLAGVGTRTSNPDYDLTRIAIQAWGEALRRPELGKHTRSFYLSAQEKLAELSARWRAEGVVPEETDDAQLATVLMSLMPGILVGHNLVAEVSADHLIGGLASLGMALAKG